METRKNAASESFHAKRRKAALIRVLLAAAAAAAALSAALYLKHRENISPEHAVRETLDQITAIDSGTISILLDENETTRLSDARAADTLQKLFEHFSYRITGSSISGDSAQVSVKITNIDMKKLAKDVREEQIRRGASAAPSLTQIDRFLSLGGYGTVSEEGQIRLIRNRKNWTIVQDENLKKLLTGSLAEDLADPDLLSAREVLQAYLDSFSSYTEKNWSSYFGQNDIFRTYAPLYPDIDTAFLNKIRDSYSARISRVDVKGAEASAPVTITSIDMKKVLDVYAKSLVSYAHTVEAITDDPATLSNTSAKALLDALNSVSDTASTSVTFTLRHTASGWQIFDTTGLTNALLGDMSGALGSFQGE